MCGLEYQRTCNTRVCERLARALRIIRIRMNWIGCRAMWSYTWGRWLWSPNKPEVGDDLMQNVMPPWTHLFKVGFACVHTSIRNPRAKGIQMDIYGDDEEDDDHLERMGCRGWCPPEVDVFWEPLDEVGYCTPLFVASDPGCPFLWATLQKICRSHKSMFTLGAHFRMNVEEHVM